VGKAKRHRKARALTRRSGGAERRVREIERAIERNRVAERVKLPSSDMGLMLLAVLDPGGAVGDRALATFAHRQASKLGVESALEGLWLCPFCRARTVGKEKCASCGAPKPLPERGDY
jgi:hypothetical protein